MVLFFFFFTFETWPGRVLYYFCEIHLYKQLCPGNIVQISWIALKTLVLHTLQNILESFLLLRKGGGLGIDILCGICCVLRRAPVSVGWHWSCAPLLQHRCLHYQGSRRCVLKNLYPLPLYCRRALKGNSYADSLWAGLGSARPLCSLITLEMGLSGTRSTTCPGPLAHTEPRWDLRNYSAGLGGRCYGCITVVTADGRWMHLLLLKAKCPTVQKPLWPLGRL